MNLWFYMVLFEWKIRNGGIECYWWIYHLNSGGWNRYQWKASHGDVSSMPSKKTPVSTFWEGDWLCIKTGGHGLGSFFPMKLAMSCSFLHFQLEKPIKFGIQSISGGLRASERPVRRGKINWIWAHTADGLWLDPYCYCWIGTPPYQIVCRIHIYIYYIFLYTRYIITYTHRIS